MNKAIAAAVAAGGVAVGALVALPGGSELCPKGWTAYASSDESHVIVRACELKDVAIVYLTDDGKFNQAWVFDRNEMTQKPSEVPGWQQ